MKNNSALFIASVFLLCSSTAANAHRLNVFAYSQAHEICVETSFQGGKPARGADVRVLTEEGAVFLTAKTEQDGKVCMALPDGFEPAPLTVIVNAGEGHQNDWTVAADELASSGTPKAVAVATVEVPATPASLVAGQAAPSAAAPVAAVSGGATPAEIERIVDAALDAKLSPIKRMLAEQTEAGPNLRDIIGGIGWISG